jgi:hypothetical protein
MPMSRPPVRSTPPATMYGLYRPVFEMSWPLIVDDRNRPTTIGMV